MSQKYRRYDFQLMSTYLRIHLQAYTHQPSLPLDRLCQFHHPNLPNLSFLKGQINQKLFSATFYYSIVIEREFKKVNYTLLI